MVSRQFVFRYSLVYLCILVSLNVICFNHEMVRLCVISVVAVESVRSAASISQLLSHQYFSIVYQTISFPSISFSDPPTFGRIRLCILQLF